MKNVKISIIILLQFCFIFDGKSQDYKFNLRIRSIDEERIDRICLQYDSIYYKMPPPRFITPNDFLDEYGESLSSKDDSIWKKVAQQGYDSTNLKEWKAYCFMKGYFRLIGSDTLNGIKREVSKSVMSSNTINYMYELGTVRYSNYKTNEPIMIIEVYGENNSVTYIFYYFIDNVLCKVKVLYGISKYNHSRSFEESSFLIQESGYLKKDEYNRDAVAYYNKGRLSLICLDSSKGLTSIFTSKKKYDLIIYGNSIVFATKSKWYWKKK